jgi:hypothetical protein
MSAWNRNEHRIRRRSNGSIDTDYYTKRAHKLRAVAFAAAVDRANRWGKKQVRAVARFFSPLRLVRTNRSNDATLHVAANGARINLRRGRLIRVENAEGFRIRCYSGVLWITQERDVRDTILQSGDAFIFSRPGLALVHALANAQFAVEDPEKTSASSETKKRQTKIEDSIVNYAAA